MKSLRSKNVLCIAAGIFLILATATILVASQWRKENLDRQGGRIEQSTMQKATKGDEVKMPLFNASLVTDDDARRLILLSVGLKWVDDQRTALHKLYPRHSWLEIDSSIIESAKGEFRTDDGGSDHKALQIIVGYMNSNPKGDYILNLDGRGAQQGAFQYQQEHAYQGLLHNRNILSDADYLREGLVEPRTLYDYLLDENNMDAASAQEYFYDLGYVVENGWLRTSIRKMDDEELSKLNSERAEHGYPPLPEDF